MLLTTTLFLVTFCGANFLIKRYSVADAVAAIIFSYAIVAILFLPQIIITNR